MSILMVLTSHDRLGDTGKPTGLWLEEFATPYYIFRDEGVKVVLLCSEQAIHVMVEGNIPDYEDRRMLRDRTRPQGSGYNSIDSASSTICQEANFLG